MRSLPSRRRVFGPEPFSRQVATHAFATAGDACFAVSLAGSLFFSVSLDAARPQVVLYLVLTMAPFAVVAPLLGPTVDRIRGGHRTVIALSFAGRAAVCFLMANDLRRILLYPEAFAVLVLGKTYSVAKSALVPELVDDPDDLVAANSRLSAVGIVASAGAGIVGAGILALVGAPWVLRAGAVVFLIGAVTTWRIPAVRRAPVASPALEYEELQSPTIIHAARVTAALRAAVGFMVFLLGFALRREGEPAWFFGLAFAASGAGGLAGTLVAGGLRRRMSEERMLAMAVVVPAVLSLAALARTTRPMILMAAFGLGVGATAGRHAFDALVQHRAPDADRGRAFAWFETLFQLAWVAGALVPVVISLDAQVGLGALGGALSVAGLWYALRARASRGLDEELRALRARVLEEATPPTKRDLPLQLLAAAEASLVGGATARAVVEATAALEVAVEAAEQHGGPGPAPSGWPERVERACEVTGAGSASMNDRVRAALATRALVVGGEAVDRRAALDVIAVARDVVEALAQVRSPSEGT